MRLLNRRRAGRGRVDETGQLRDRGRGQWGGRFKAVGRSIGKYSVEAFAEFVGADIKFTTGILQEDCQALRNRYFARK